MKSKLFTFFLAIISLGIKAQQVINIESKQYDSRDSGWHGNVDFAQTQFNQQIGLKYRGLLGAGPRIRLFYADSMKIFVGPMWMYEYEQKNCV
ncbi:MAG: hypothetical protein SGJ00_00395 [bacterium]|nr:hypothetical protein [bacterium]